jgi:hypothetical protein
MTNALARTLQTWFTSRMPTSSIPTRRIKREDIYSKAERILSDPSRVKTRRSSPHGWTGEVVGDTGTYFAFAISTTMQKIVDAPARLGCYCPAGVKGKLCSHAIVAEEMRLREETP